MNNNILKAGIFFVKTPHTRVIQGHVTDQIWDGEWQRDPPELKGCKRDLQLVTKKVTSWITWSLKFPVLQIHRFDVVCFGFVSGIFLC